MCSGLTTHHNKAQQVQQTAVASLLALDAGQTGLEVCSGLTTDRKKAQEAQWVAFDPVPGAITINIGDSLQYWSDGALKSTYHRVRCPTAEDYAVSLLTTVYA